MFNIEMATGRAGPENPGPRAFWAEMGQNWFLFNSPLCNGKFKFLLVFYKFY